MIHFRFFLPILEYVRNPVDPSNSPSNIAARLVKFTTESLNSPSIQPRIVERISDLSDLIDQSHLGKKEIELPEIKHPGQKDRLKRQLSILDQIDISVESESRTEEESHGTRDKCGENVYFLFMMHLGKSE